MTSKDQQLPDIAFHLDQLGETTTAAELVRQKGQSKKLKVINEKKLMEWILALLQQHLASKADVFSDEEKQQLVAKAQEELQKRMKLQQELEGERSRQVAEGARIAETLENSKKTKSDYEKAMEALRARLEQSEKAFQDLQQDNYELHDQLAEKMALLSTTIDEKNRDRERLQVTLRNQMIRSTSLIEGLFGLDNGYYGSRHQTDNPPPDELTDEEKFFHDFDIGAAIVATLAADLERLREIAKRPDQTAAEKQSLESDLALLAELKNGSLAAIDVAQPVAGLCAAVEGLRAEAIGLEGVAAEAAGVPRDKTPITEVPDAEGKPAEVIAGAATVLRELGALLARERSRISALKSLAEEADHARSDNESELETAQKALREQAEMFDRLLTRGGKQAPVSVTTSNPNAATSKLAEQVREAGAALEKQVAEGRDRERDIADQVKALAKAKVESSEDADDVGAALMNLEGVLKRKDAAPAAQADAAKQVIAALQQQLRKDGGASAKQVQQAQSELAAAKARLKEIDAALAASRSAEAALCAQLRDLGKLAFPSEDRPAHATASFSAGATKVAELDRVIERGQPGEDAIAAARSVVEALKKDASRREERLKAARVELDQLSRQNAELHEKIGKLTSEVSAARNRAEELGRSERELSEELVRAAQGDDSLAESAADLALTLDNAGIDPHELSAHSKLAVRQLIKRKQALAEENAKSSAEIAEARRHGGARAKGLEQEIARLVAEQDAAAKQLTAAKTAHAELTKEHEAVVADRAEMALAGKEVIQQLRDQIAHRNQDLEALRATSQASDKELAGLRLRAEHASASTQGLIETLSQLAQAAGDDPATAAARAKLEQALTETPNDASVPLRAETAAQLGAASRELIQGLTSRADRLGRDLDLDRASLRRIEGEKAQIARDLDQSRRQLGELKESLKEVTGERDEMAASGKEVIQQLREQMGRREQELGELRAHETKSTSELARAQNRIEHAESANRQLCEALAMLAKIEADAGGADAVENGRVDLELALSELPAEGETDVVMPEDLALRLADAGKRVADAVASRRRGIQGEIARSKAAADGAAAELGKVRTDLDAARARLSDNDGALKRVNAELTVAKNELRDQSSALAAKTQDLSEARSALARVSSDLDGASVRLKEQGDRLQKLDAEAPKLRSEVADLREREKQISTRAAATDQAHAQLANALRALATWKGDEGHVGRMLADGNDSVGKAAQKLQAAAETKNPEAVASAGLALGAALRDRVRDLAGELAQARETLAGSQRVSDQARETIAGLKAAIVGRDHEIESLKDELKTASHHAERAEDSVRTLANSLHRHLDQAEAEPQAYQALSAAVAQEGQPFAREAAQAGSILIDELVERSRRAVDERKRMQQELALAERDQGALKATLAEASGRLAALDQELREGGNRNRALAAAAADLSKQILVATKAMIADSDPEAAKKLGKTVAELDKAEPAKQVELATGMMPALREHFTHLAIDVAEMKARAAADRDQWDRQAAELQHEIDEARAALERSRAELATAKDEQGGVHAKLMDAQQRHDALATTLKQAQEDLLHATAELDDYRARAGESTGAGASEAQRLQQELSDQSKSRDQLERELASLRERVEAADAKLRKQREELAKRLAERDEAIEAKSKEVDALNARLSDIKSEEATIAALKKELSEVHERIKEYEQVHGEHAGASSKAGDLQKQLKDAKAERGRLLDKIRDFEAEAADAAGSTEELNASLAERRKELEGIRDKHAAELVKERDKTGALREEVRKLKEENVGLKARVRRLTDG